MNKDSECRKWASGDPLLMEYHDHEWCKISHDDRYIFEMLCLEGQSTGLSWRTIINKRSAYEDAFCRFDIRSCAKLDDTYLDSLMDDHDLIRNRNKLYSIRNNALAALKIIEEFGSLNAYVWSYMKGKQSDGKWRKLSEIPVRNPVSEKLSSDLKKRGFSFVGPVISYSFMQAIGMVNDHLIDCPYR